jgi:hypothetical protein
MELIYNVTKIELDKFEYKSFDKQRNGESEHRLDFDFATNNLGEYYITIYHAYLCFQDNEIWCNIETTVCFTTNSRKIDDLIFLSNKAMDFTMAILSVESAKTQKETVKMVYIKQEKLRDFIINGINSLN